MSAGARWARVPPGQAHRFPWLPTNWVRVVDPHPGGFKPLPGYCYIDLPGKIRHVQERDLEFREDPPVSTTEAGRWEQNWVQPGPAKGD